jgi:nucleotide-binding universal stress UspA family protein
MVPDIKKILYATDLSQNSSSLVFSYAVDIARKYHATVLIVHVVEHVHQVSYAGTSVTAMMQNDQRQKQETSLEELNARIHAFCKRTERQMSMPCMELVSKILIPVGHPVEEILKIANTEQCDAIVMGTHRKGFWTNAFLGSVARSVLERSLIPVFIVPLPSEETYREQDTMALQP